MANFASRSSLILQEYIPLLPRDRTICTIIADIVIVQSVLVFIGSGSILYCVWNPDLTSMDYDKLFRIMYLFDANACGYTLKRSKDFMNLQFSNATNGYNVLPIKWREPFMMISTKLSAKTRMYIQISVVFHILWVIIALILWIFAKNCVDVRSLKFVLAVFFYSSVFMIMFDTSMALVYIGHVKQSLTKGMVLRYSGWSTTVKLHSYDNFAGWLPIIASVCWMRGILILMLNIYCCRIIKKIRGKMRKREIKWKYENERYRVIPEAKPIYYADKTLFYRADVDGASLF